MMAQKTINASEIETAIKSGKDVSYENVTIIGVLDLTSAREDLPNLPKLKKWNMGDNTIETTHGVNISFINCTFDNAVYAYFHDDKIKWTDGNSYYTFVAHFDDDVIFKNCTFEDRAWFKYSEFDGNADFSGTSFFESNTFKYAEFSQKANFANTNFEDDNSFKYSNFSTFVSFENAVFDEEAVFKYAEFEKGVSFENAKFKDDLNFKYVDIDGEYIDKNMTVRGYVNTKYANIEGRDSYKKKRKKNKKKG